VSAGDHKEVGEFREKDFLPDLLDLPVSGHIRNEKLKWRIGGNDGC
jgi:hypothetical protein